MSLPSTHGVGTIELKCHIRGLEVTISGPSAEASDLLRHVTSWTGPRESSPAPTSTSFEFVDSHPQAASSVSVGETRAQIEASFPACPGLWFAKAKKLCGSAKSGEERIARAWKAGLWASAVKQGRVRSPNRTPPLDLRSRFYAVVRAEGLQQPTLFCSANSYFRAVGDLQTSTSISQAFPSELEASIYFDAAGVDHFDKQP